MSTISLRNLKSFGDVAAEDDAVLDYFLTTDAVHRLENNEAFLVLGRKGAGKTALVRHFTEGNSATLSKSLNLRGYPWNVHAQRIDHGASQIEAYVSSWRYLLAVEVAALVLSKTERPQFDKVIALSKFFEENYGGINPALSDILRPHRLKLNKLSLQPSVMGNALGGIELSHGGSDMNFGLELNALSKSIIETAAAIAKNESFGQMAIHFDELDQGLANLDEQRSLMLVGLILAARELRRECEALGISLNPIVYLRTDIWDDLNFSDKNKISQTASLNLDWDQASLLDVVQKRLQARLDKDAKWEDIINPDLIRGSQTKWNHLIARTFLRPRDIIRFLNAALAKAKLRSAEPLVLENEDIVNAREQYSAYLKKELDDEILPHWPCWEEALRSCSAISTITFEKSEFVEHYNVIRSAKNTVDAEQALELLYRFSAIGYERRSGYGGSSWAFQYTNPEAGWDSGVTKFKVHLGLKEYAKLRESRASE